MRRGSFAPGIMESPAVLYFARKLIRTSGSVTRKDIENEAAVISKLCQAGYSSCKNVVEVYGHGWLDKTKIFYFIDMEYCSETLEARIRSPPKHTEQNNVRLHHVGNIESQEQHIEDRHVGGLGHEGLPSPNVPEFARENPEVHDVLQFDFESVARIVKDIVSGLIHLHENEIVHGDLKPANGIFLTRENTNILQWSTLMFTIAGN